VLRELWSTAKMRKVLQRTRRLLYVLDRTNGKLIGPNPFVEAELGQVHRPQDRPPGSDRSA